MLRIAVRSQWMMPTAARRAGRNGGRAGAPACCAGLLPQPKSCRWRKAVSGPPTPKGTRKRGQMAPDQIDDLDAQNPPDIGEDLGNGSGRGRFGDSGKGSLIL